MPDDTSVLVDQLNCDDIIKCQNARRAIIALGQKTAVPVLVEALNSKKQWVRWEAAKALATLGNPSAIKALVEALEDNNFDIRWLAAEGLIKVGKKSIVPLLKTLIVNPDSTFLRQGAHHVLHDMDLGDWNKILKPVIAALDRNSTATAVPLVSKKALDEIEKLSVKE